MAVETVHVAVCRICGLTEHRVSPPPSRWPEGDLCQACADTADVLAWWLRRSKWRAKGALFREAEAREKRGTN